MAALPITSPTLLDLKSILGMDGSIQQVVDILATKNDLAEVMPFFEATDITSNLTVQTTGYASTTWRKLNKGVSPSTGSFAQIRDSLGQLTSMSVVDARTLDLSGDPGTARARFDMLNIGALANDYATGLFYANETLVPESFMGLTPRYDSTSAVNGQNLLAGGAANGQTDCTSIWLLTLGPNTTHGLYARGTQAGLKKTDMNLGQGGGPIPWSDGAGGYYPAFASFFTWDVGLSVRDWRYNARIHSIDVSTLTKSGTATNDSDIIDLMSRAIFKIPDRNAGKMVFCMNSTVMAWLASQMRTEVASSTLTWDQAQGGKPIMLFSGIPVLRCDAIVNTETSKN